MVKKVFDFGNMYIVVPVIYILNFCSSQYNWTIHVWRQGGLMSNYFDHML